MNLRFRKALRWMVIFGCVVVGGIVLRHLFFWQPETPSHLIQNRVLIIGHKGASGLAPENTLVAFQAAMDEGADAIELDVQLSQDGVPVVIHDLTVDATTNGTGKVKELTLTQLKELDAGSWYGSEFAGEPVPTLEEALEIVKGKLVYLNIELKTVDPYPNALAREVVKLVEKHQMEEQVVISSFHPLALAATKNHNSAVPVGLLYDDNLPFILRDRWFASVVHPANMHPGKNMATLEHVQELHNRGHLVVTWTVNEPAEMRELANAGVDGIITDRPDLLRDVLAEMERGQ